MHPVSAFIPKAGRLPLLDSFFGVGHFRQAEVVEELEREEEHLVTVAHPDPSRRQQMQPFPYRSA